MSDDPDPTPFLATGPTVEIVDAERLLTRSQTDLLTRLATSAAALAAPGLTGELRVRLVNDQAMSLAHERYSGVRGTTDVLTFDLRTPPPTPTTTTPLDTDLLVCVDEARRQAATRSLPIEHELLLYILHGLLHCLGHDDHDDDAFLRMHAEEDRLLTALGLGPVFAPAPRGADS